MKKLKQFEFIGSVISNENFGLKIWPGTSGTTILRIIFKDMLKAFSFGVELGKVIQKNELNIIEEKGRRSEYRVL